jgi:hypothetical protein
MNIKALRFVVFLTTVFLLLLFTGLYLTSVWDGELFLSVLAGSLIVILNFFIGFLFIKLSLPKRNDVFLSMLWGGMAFRLIFILILVFILLKFLELNAIGFIFSIFFFYVFYLIIEIFYLNLKKTEQIGR